MVDSEMKRKGFSTNKEIKRQGHFEPLPGNREILHQKYEIQDELNEKGEKKNKHIIFHNINPEWYVYQPIEPSDVMLFERIGEGMSEEFCKRVNEIPYLPKIVDSFTEEGKEYIVSPLFEMRPLIQLSKKPLYDPYLFNILYQLCDAIIRFKENSISLKHIDISKLMVDEDFNIKFFIFPEEDNDEKIDVFEIFSDFAITLLTKVFGGTITHKLETTSENQILDLPISDELKEISLDVVSGRLKDLEIIRNRIKSYTSWKRQSVEIGYGSDIGMLRDLDEDAIMLIEKKIVIESKSLEYKLFAIADGMGGHEGGEIASRLTIENLARAIQSTIEDSNIKNPRDICNNVRLTKQLSQVIDYVNKAVYEFTRSERYKSAKAKPGSTLVFAFILDNMAYIGNVGDSRAYLYREGEETKLYRLTKDHSYVQKLIDKGEITEEEAFKHKDKSLILSNIGVEKLPMKDVFIRTLKDDDILLLCCDGLTDMLRESEIEDIISKSKENDEDLQTLCNTLIKKANEKGGEDNISLILANFKFFNNKKRRNDG